jgi:hypothetical protein
MLRRISFGQDAGVSLAVDDMDLAKECPSHGGHEEGVVLFLTV